MSQIKNYRNMGVWGCSRVLVRGWCSAINTGSGAALTTQSRPLERINRELCATTRSFTALVSLKSRRIANLAESILTGHQRPTAPPPTARDCEGVEGEVVEFRTFRVIPAEPSAYPTGV